MRTVDFQEPNHVIWSNEHKSWWRPDSHGYTADIGEAGLYTMQDALVISHKGRDGWDGRGVPSELAIHVSALPAEALEAIGWIPDGSKPMSFAECVRYEAAVLPGALFKRHDDTFHWWIRFDPDNAGRLMQCNEKCPEGVDHCDVELYAHDFIDGEWVVFDPEAADG